MVQRLYPPIIGWRAVLLIGAVIVVGLMAGIVFGTGLAQYSARVLPASAWVARHQAEDALFGAVMPIVWPLTVAVLAAAAAAARGARAPFAVAAVLFAAALAVTVTREVPLNRVVQSWAAAAPPPEWTAVRDRWLVGHLARTLLTAGGFALAAVGLARAFARGGTDVRAPEAAVARRSP
ncbi:hypothetical protein tb265_44940 [Gemmatimonadetes bacterium T265]|nr:hypothetical protein tb265_44940 [Gemmatimonadetes bacterium T265]